jgi:hypothetical protein
VITYLKTATLLLGVLVFGLASAVAQQEDNQKLSNINILVVRENGGKPVKNAEIVLHLLDKHGNQKQAGLELKTHEDGKAGTSGVPYGKVRIQVIAQGFRTWGDDFEVAQPNMEITIKLQKPKEQFSIYK